MLLRGFERHSPAFVLESKAAGVANGPSLMAPHRDEKQAVKPWHRSPRLRMGIAVSRTDA